MNAPLVEPRETGEIVRDKPALLSCIIPAYNEADNLPHLVPELTAALSELAHQVELVVVDDGSRDDTLLQVARLSQDYPIKWLALSRNFGKENAITAGLDHVSGDVVIIMDADCQHPVQVLSEFVRRWRQGYDMAYGVRQDREDQALWKRTASRFFYALISRGADVPIIPNAGDFRLMDRKVVDAIRSLPERNRFMKGIYSWVGFNSIGVPFSPAERAVGESRFSPVRLFELAMSGLTSFSDIPLRIWSAIGGLVSLLAIFYGLYIIIRTLLFGVDLPGWATLAAGVTFLGGIQLLSIGILGEYISRVFSEVKQRPTYIVSKKQGFDDDRDDAPS
ncbi:MAG: glycosyltransferase family 2 protein [Alcanivorax sp.]|nr:glycosyltransferase family 2 protein [Alcanivorax sp.]